MPDQPEPAMLGMGHGSQAGLGAMTENVRPKHVEIDDALNNLESKLYRLQDLIDEIRGQSVNEKEPDQPMPVPTLQEVLQTSPKRIAEISYRLEDQIQHLRDLLF